MWCVIPAAGRGTRLGPLSLQQPKPLLSIDGQPLLDHLLERLAPAITNACVIISPSSDAIREEMGSERYGISIDYVVQPEPLGVADAVWRARHRVDGPFVVVMGDVYYEQGLGGYIETWRRSGADGAALVESMVDDAQGAIGIVRVKDGRIVEIRKAPYAGQAAERVCGLLILPEAAFDACENARPDAAGELELEDVVAGLIRRGFRFIAMRYEGWRRNINTPGDLRRVLERLSSPSL